MGPQRVFFGLCVAGLAASVVLHVAAWLGRGPGACMPLLAVGVLVVVWPALYFAREGRRARSAGRWRLAVYALVAYGLVLEARDGAARGCGNVNAGEPDSPSRALATLALCAALYAFGAARLDAAMRVRGARPVAR
jgi:hypothetical protein